jgi:hypothetical protein
MCNQLGPRNDKDTVLHFTCQVVKDKMVASIPLASPFIRLLHERPEDLAKYTRHLTEQSPEAATLKYQKEIGYEKNDMEDIRISLTHEICRSWTDIKEISCLLMADNSEEFSELLDVLLGTNILPWVKCIILGPQLNNRKRPRG